MKILGIFLLGIIMVILVVCLAIAIYVYWSFRKLAEQVMTTQKFESYERRLQEVERRLNDDDEKMSCDDGRQIKGESSEIHEEYKLGQTEQHFAESVVDVKTSKKMYATATAEGADNEFFRVSEEPNDDTIFIFVELEKNRWEFEIYENAKRTVLKDRAFLEGSCICSGSGKTHMIVISKGIAELTQENKWIVSKKANVKFE